MGGREKKIRLWEDCNLKKVINLYHGVFTFFFFEIGIVDRVFLIFF